MAREGGLEADRKAARAKLDAEPELDADLARLFEDFLLLDASRAIGWGQPAPITLESIAAVFHGEQWDETQSFMDFAHLMKFLDKIAIEDHRKKHPPKEADSSNGR